MEELHPLTSTQAIWPSICGVDELLPSIRVGCFGASRGGHRNLPFFCWFLLGAKPPLIHEFVGQRLSGQKARLESRTPKVAVCCALYDRRINRLSERVEDHFLRLFLSRASWTASASSDHASHGFENNTSTRRCPNRTITFGNASFGQGQFSRIRLASLPLGKARHRHGSVTNEILHYSAWFATS